MSTDLTRPAGSASSAGFHPPGTIEKRSIVERREPHAQRTGRAVSGGAFSPRQLWQSLPDAVRKLDPRAQLRNPVMFVVWAGSVGGRVWQTRGVTCKAPNCTVSSMSTSNSMMRPVILSSPEKTATGLLSGAAAAGPASTVMTSAGAIQRA